MNALEKTERHIQAMKDKKAFDIVTIDVSERTSVCDYFVVASANNVIQTHAIAEKIDEDLAKEGENALRIEGGRGAKWVAMDYSDVIVHSSRRPAWSTPPTGIAILGSTCGRRIKKRARS